MSPSTVRDSGSRRQSGAVHGGWAGDGYHRDGPVDSGSDDDDTGNTAIGLRASAAGTALDGVAVTLASESSERGHAHGRDLSQPLRSGFDAHVELTSLRADGVPATDGDAAAANDGGWR